MHTVTRNIGGRDLTIETGNLAKLTDGAVLVKYGDTQVLVTAVGAEAREGMDFFPLSVEYREMTYAAGKFPGGFFKREGRPTAKETLTARLIDRPIRPLWPEGYKEEVQVVAMVLSADKENDPDILAVNGGSAALALSQLPFQGPVGAVRVGQVEGELVVNPTTAQLEESALNIVVVASREGVVMVEGAGNEVEEEVMVSAIRFGFDQAQEAISLQEELISAAGVPKEEIAPKPELEELFNTLNSKYRADIEGIDPSLGKKARGAVLKELRGRIVEENEMEEGPSRGAIIDAFYKLEEDICRKNVLGGKRDDGRAPDQLRQIASEVSVLPMTHGSALFTRGETQALVVVTLGTASDEQKIDGLEEAYYKHFLLHYNFPPFSVGEARPMRGPRRRDIGHGALAERSLVPVLPDREEFPYTIRIVSEILESNGSSSMASVCGGTLALMDAGVPIKRPVAGIAMGLVIEGDQAVVLTDIAGAEDHGGDMDLKVAGTQKGITGLQMDIKVSSIKVDLFDQAFAQAKDARLEILRVMLAAIAEPRDKVSDKAPKLVRLTIDPEMIGKVIGPGGKMVRALQEETQTKVEINDEGVVLVSGETHEQVAAAVKRIEAVTMVIEEGAIFEEAKVVSVRDELGAFVEIAPGREGLLHISEISNDYVENASDFLKEGDVVRVKVVRVGDDGKIRLSKKALEPGGSSGGGGGPRGGGDRGGRGGGRDGRRDGGRRRESRDRR